MDMIGSNCNCGCLVCTVANAAIKVTKFDKGLHKFRGMKRPKMKSLNIVKKLYKHTKQKKGKRHFSHVIKGKVIDGVNELYTLTAGIMLALRCTVSYFNDIGYLWLIISPLFCAYQYRYPPLPTCLAYTVLFYNIIIYCRLAKCPSPMRKRIF